MSRHRPPPSFQFEVDDGPGDDGLTADQLSLLEDFNPEISLNTIQDRLDYAMERLREANVAFEVSLPPEASGLSGKALGLSLAGFEHVVRSRIRQLPKDVHDVAWMAWRASCLLHLLQGVPRRAFASLWVFVDASLKLGEPAAWTLGQAEDDRPPDEKVTRKEIEERLRDETPKFRELIHFLLSKHVTSDSGPARHSGKSLRIDSCISSAVNMLKGRADKSPFWRHVIFISGESYGGYGLQNLAEE